ncbi:cell division protein FtsQ [Paenibacillus sp. TRM 82003]|nr:cell division protein FtsQ [Paenibacillus sp. TRM 82003]
MNAWKKPLSPAQKTMVFVLSMSLFGLSDLVTELIPQPEFGPIELNIPYFAFIPLVLAILFSPLHAALGAALGELIFGDLLMGDFGGLSELEGFLQLFIGIYIAGLLVRNVKKTGVLIAACLIGVGIEQLLAFVTDVAKVWVGVEEFEAVDGLPQSIIAVEGVEFLYEMLVAGVIVGVLPVLYLVPRLHGKIEPLLGMRPRTPEDAPLQGNVLSAKWISLIAGVGLAAAAIAIVTGMDFNPGEWEAGFAEELGSSYVWIVIGVAAVIALVTFLVAANANKKRGAGSDSKAA